MKRVAAFFLLAFFALPSFAITWGGDQVDDPILTGKKCSVARPLSSGSYIYQYSSKYDMVFWPLTDRNGIWSCEHSGYVSFMGDFKELTPQEKVKISAYLAGKKISGLDLNETLLRLEDIYALRDLQPEAKNQYLRVFAQWYQDAGDLRKANAYRKSAFIDIESKLKSALSEDVKIEYLYLAANYARLFGDVGKSDGYLVSLHSAIAKLKNKKFASFAKYIKELSKETSGIKPGGKIDPEKTEQEKSN
jgi:hypothetical protein